MDLEENNIFEDLRNVELTLHAVDQALDNHKETQRNLISARTKCLDQRRKINRKIREKK